MIHLSDYDTTLYTEVTHCYLSCSQCTRGWVMMVHPMIWMDGENFPQDLNTDRVIKLQKTSTSANWYNNIWSDVHRLFLIYNFLARSAVVKVRRVSSVSCVVTPLLLQKRIHSDLIEHSRVFYSLSFDVMSSFNQSFPIYLYLSYFPFFLTQNKKAHKIHIQRVFIFIRDESHLPTHTRGMLTYSYTILYPNGTHTYTKSTPSKYFPFDSQFEAFHYPFHISWVFFLFLMQHLSMGISTVSSIFYRT